MARATVNAQAVAAGMGHTPKLLLDRAFPEGLKTEAAGARGLAHSRVFSIEVRDTGPRVSRVHYLRVWTADHENYHWASHGTDHWAAHYAHYDFLDNLSPAN